MCTINQRPIWKTELFFKKINSALSSQEDCDRKDWMLRDPLRNLQQGPWQVTSGGPGVSLIWWASPPTPMHPKKWIEAGPHSHMAHQYIGSSCG